MTNAGPLMRPPLGCPHVVSATSCQVIVVLALWWSSRDYVVRRVLREKITTQSADRVTGDIVSVYFLLSFFLFRFVSVFGLRGLKRGPIPIAHGEYEESVVLTKPYV